MSDFDLDPETRELVALARRETSAPHSARARIWRSVELELAEPAAMAPWGFGKLTAAKGVVGLALLASAAVVTVWYGDYRLTPSLPLSASRPGTSPRSIEAASPPRAVSSAAAEPPSIVAAVTAPPSTIDAVAAPPRAPRTPRRKRSSLAQETALLTEITTALNRRDGAAALARVQDHSRRHPAGTLSAERDAARVFAWCLLGDQVNARASAARFLTTWPDSPLVARVQSSCGNEPLVTRSREGEPNATPTQERPSSAPAANEGR